MPFLLAPDGVATRSPSGAASYIGGSTQEIAAADLSDIAIGGQVPSVDYTVSIGISPAQTLIVQSGFAPSAIATEHRRVLPGFSGLLIDGFEAIASADASIAASPTRAHLLLDGYQLSAASSDHKRAQPSTADILMAVFPPLAIATAHKWAETDTSAIQFLGHDAAITAGSSIVLQAVRADILFSGVAASAAVSDHKMAAPAWSGLDILGFEPMALVPLSVGAGYAGIVHSGSVPETVATASIWILPQQFALGLSGLSPIVTADASTVLGPVYSGLVITGRTADFALTDHKLVLPVVSGINISGFATAALNPKIMWPGLAMLALDGFNPAAGVTADRFVQPDRATITVSGFPVDFISPQTLWPLVSSLDVSCYLPGAHGGLSVHQDVFALSVGTYAPGLEITEDQFARVGAGALMVMDAFDPFIHLPRVRFPGTSDIHLFGGVPLSHAIIPVALMDFVARPGGEMTGVIVKHPWAEVRVAVDWRPYIERQQTSVQTSEWVETTDLGTVTEGAFISNNICSVEIGGGAPATAPIVENRVSFADGSRDVFRVRVQVAGVA